MSRKVHRGLSIGHRGADVEQLRYGINRKAEGWDLPHLKVRVDASRLSRSELEKATKLLHAMGGHGKMMRRLRKHDPVLSEYAQRLLRGTRPRTPVMLALSLDRRPQVRGWRRAARRPKVISARSIGIAPDGIFGPLGSVSSITGHHSAGPTDDSDEHAIALCRSFDADHRSYGWGGIGYHFNIARSGTIICLRPIGQKGAHVGNFNTGNVGIMCHGTTGDLPTAAQERSLHWLLRNAHTAAMPPEHRAPRSLAGKQRYGHNDWPGHTTNACPGTHKPMYLRGGSSR